MRKHADYTLGWRKKECQQFKGILKSYWFFKQRKIKQA